MTAAGCRVGLAAVIPPECQSILLDLSVMVEKMRLSDGDGSFPFRKLKANFGADGIRFLVHLAERHRLDFRRVAKVQGAERPIDRVARHVAKRTRAEILPASPNKWTVDSLLIIWIATALKRPHRSRSNPTCPNPKCQVSDFLPTDDPCPAARPGGSSRRALDALAQRVRLESSRPRGASPPQHCPDPHLRDNFFLFRHFSQTARLIDRLRQWFLAKNGLVHLHRRRRHNRA